MNCPACGAPMRFEGGKECMSCDYCGNIFFPEANADGVRVFGVISDLQCPVCHRPLQHAALKGERLLYCERCRGLLVDVDTFPNLIESLRPVMRESGPNGHRLNPRELERRLICPRCREPMDTHPYGGAGNIVIDNCPQCELNWLDHGEIGRVARGTDCVLPD